jgi:hypothetical protein
MVDLVKLWHQLTHTLCTSNTSGGEDREVSVTKNSRVSVHNVCPYYHFDMALYAKGSTMHTKCYEIICLNFSGITLTIFAIHFLLYFFTILVPATECGYFVASWWLTPLRHPPKVTRFYFQKTWGIHEPVGNRKGCFLSGRSPANIADSFMLPQWQGNTAC